MHFLHLNRGVTFLFLPKNWHKQGRYCTIIRIKTTSSYEIYHSSLHKRQLLTEQTRKISTPSGWNIYSCTREPRALEIPHVTGVRIHLHRLTLALSPRALSGDIHPRHWMDVLCPQYLPRGHCNFMRINVSTTYGWLYSKLFPILFCLHCPPVVTSI